ncbi:PKD domain-containing protein [Aurantibacillus circumpalustris]|uniref:PKD domain-containing protein n=1 Tax=Aurantibacillus circumpalustris TaxID=3036359 RepID=UPI00295AE3AA|nr:PKD domain-containing protein [Aurantibacillus circumpalustris]
MKKLINIVLFLLFSYNGFSFHIVGGELIYNDLGNGKYQIILKIYRDCAAANASGFDGIEPAGPAYLTVYDASNTFIGIYDIGAPVITPVPPAFNNPCILAPNTICIEEGVYTDTLDLPPKLGGYTLVYQRCCRNSIIENLSNPDGQGATYFARIPGPEDAVINSSPRFSKFPPIYICRSVPLKFDHSAIDPDGDQLVYSLCAPYAGLDACCASIGQQAPPTGGTCVSPPASCPTEATPPPYTNVFYIAPYSGTYPIDGNPAFAINPVTGELSGTPTLTGQYVVGIRVEEYRNNKLLNSHLRDFQFTVIGCTVNVLSVVADQKQQCQGQTIAFTNQSINNSSTPIYHWDFGVPSIASDTSNILNPTYMYQDTGIYMLTLITNPGKPCTDTLKKPVYVYPPLKINFDKLERQCFKNNAFNFNVGGDYLPQTTYEWDFSAQATPSTSILKNPVGIHYTEGGLFYVALRAKQFACRDTFTDSIRVIGRPHAKINNIQNGLCDPARISFSNGSSSDLPVRYFWNLGNSKTTTSFEPTHVFTPAGTYTVSLTVETTELCKDTSIAILTNIVVNPKPLAIFTISPRETSIFEPDISINTNITDGGFSTCTFSFGDGYTSNNKLNLHTYTDFGTYTVVEIIKNTFGCSDTMTDVVKILPEFRFWIPNSFTPDDNGQNDVFKPSVIGIQQYQFELFNRWGQRIFLSKNPEDGWNGYYKGLESPQGIYIWKISFKNLVSEKTESHVGHVTLLRNP